MKIILSRKGFDTSSGGVPSPIFPDGRILSLPIPDKYSTIRYEDIKWNEFNVGDIVSSLTKNKIPKSHFAHLDPDLRNESLKRHDNWKPVLGQTSSSQGHLRNQNIQQGDIFIFFGLFRDVINKNSKINFKEKTLSKHIIWGWLQIEDILTVDNCNKSDFVWALNHPHFHRPIDALNTIYTAKEKLDITGSSIKTIPGYGVFNKYSRTLQLSKEGSSKPSVWSLPHWFYPSNSRTPLSYHSKISRWSHNNSEVILESVSRGQEFVLDCDIYPESKRWIIDLMKCS